MKRALKIFYLPALAFSFFLLGSCNDAGAVFDQNTSIPNHNWAYLHKVKYDVKIDDESVPYTVCLNLRVTADYKYSNIFVLVSSTGPDKKASVKRYEFKLANKDGEWLGEGSGNLYSYQVPFLKNIKLLKGLYHFEIEQNMRDNPLREVSDVGLRIEKAQ